MPAATTCPRVKPTMQLYRPPTLRAPGDLSPGPYPTEGSPDSLKKPGLNINAKEFVSLSASGLSSPTGDTVSFSGPNGPTPSALKHSKSAGKVVPGTNGWDLTHSKSGGQIGSRSRESRGGGPIGASPPLRVHFTDDTITYDPDNKIGMAERVLKGSNGSPIGGPIKRSKSVGSATDLASKNGLLCAQTMDFVPSNNAQGALEDLGTFSEETKAKFKEVLQNPNSASARVIMEVVTELFTRLSQASKFGEPAARYCIAVIEKESSGQNFLETLLNTCQEYYQERDQLLRGVSPTRFNHQVSPQTHTKWIAYMTFLHEMYSQVKRRQRISVSSTAPGNLLLTLLAECCVVSLEDHAAGGASLTQIECLFFILTGVGRDIETELPPLMGKVMSAARDCFFSPTKSPAMKKTLLQLIEMNAASWQLPAQAVMYYYPTVGK